PAAATERLEHELGVINRMGFASYFLIVWDFVRFAREAGIPSSARGSACGALVSYLLELSHVCPLKYDLLFERFLDPSRSEAPDIDIDLCKERRYEVIEYVRGKYGAANVAQIGTFGTMAAKAALKDVGRALNIPLARVDQVTKLIPTKLNITLDEQRRGAPLDLFSLPLEDETTYKLLQRGEAKGIFQLDGAGIRDLLVKMKPDRFADLIAILALYRPGPLNGGMVDEYVDVKHGRKHASYPHLVMKDVLRSEEHTSELQSRGHLVCRLLLEKKKETTNT